MAPYGRKLRWFEWALIQCDWCPYKKIFFDPPPEVRKIKTKINKWDLIKLKSFCTAKEMIDKMKTYWMGGNICKWFAKGLISKIHKQLLQFNSKEKPIPDPKTKKRKRKPNNPIEKLAAALNRHFFSKKTYRWATDTWKGNANQNHNDMSPHTC